jgi:hypothetical protein
MTNFSFFFGSYTVLVEAGASWAINQTELVMTLTDGVISLDDVVDVSVPQGLETAAFVAATSLVEYYQRVLAGKSGRSIPVTREATWQETRTHRDKAKESDSAMPTFISLIQGLKAGSYDEYSPSFTFDEAYQKAKEIIAKGVGRVALTEVESSYAWYEDMLYYYQGRIVVQAERFDAWHSGNSISAESYTLENGVKFNGELEYRPFQSEWEHKVYVENKEHVGFMEFVALF